LSRGGGRRGGFVVKLFDPENIVENGFDRFEKQQFEVGHKHFQPQYRVENKKETIQQQKVVSSNFYLNLKIRELFLD